MAMTRAEQYRTRAKEAEAEAERAREEHIKQGFLKMAREWRELAEKIEEQKRG
jgi:hypothetical protein